MSTQQNPTRPRQVSFSDVLRPGGLGLSMSSLTMSTSSAISSGSSNSSASTTRSAPRSLPRSPAPPKIRPAPTSPTTPLQRSTRSYARSPYVPTHVCGESTGGDTDVFGESPPGWSATPPRFKASLSTADSDHDKENGLLGTSKSKLQIMSPAWGVPRSPEGSESSHAHSPSPSPSHRKSALPRLDFSRTGTPLTARKLFTPRRLAPESPTKTLGRKISLHGLGAAFGDCERETRRTSTLAQDCDDEDESSFGDDEDADEVDLALELASLSVSSSKGPMSSTPSRSPAEGVPAPATTAHSFRGNSLVMPELSFQAGSPFSNSAPSPDLLGARSPASSHSSPTTSPPTKIPSVPCTPAAATGYDSDDSEVFVPRAGRRIAGARRIVDSDDSDDGRPQTAGRSPQATGLRGRIPASIMRLNQSSTHDCDNENSRQYLDLEAEDEDSHSGDDSYDEEKDTEGSIAAWINDNEVDFSARAAEDEDESEESYEEGAVSEDEDEENERPRPRYSQVFKPGRYDYSNDSMGSIRDMIEGDYEEEGADQSFRPSSRLERERRERALVTERRKTYQEVIEVADSSDEDDDEATNDHGNLEGDYDVTVDNDDINVLDDDEESNNEVGEDEEEGRSVEVNPRAGENDMASDPEGTSMSQPQPDIMSDDDYLLHFSPPPPPMALPDLGSLRLEDFDTSDVEIMSPPKVDKKAAQPKPPKPTRKGSDKPQVSKKQWETDRVKIAQEFFDELDRLVFDRRLGRSGVKATLEWSANLRTSAGNANRKKTTKPDGSVLLSYKINLSNKVLTTEQQIRDTLAHEMCHLAAWVISNELKNPHGRVFKSWGWKVMRACPDIEVTTKHTYQIEYKYSWRCTNTACAKVYQRHSKSIDTDRQVCGSCRSKLQPCFETRSATAYQVFMKEQQKAAKAAMPRASQPDILRAIAKRWSENPQGDHTAYWRSVAAGAS